MNRHQSIVTAGIVALTAAGAGAFVASHKWEVHDVNRPMAPVITPGTEYGQPPSDAIVLFDGKDLSQWASVKGGSATWKVENGYMEVNKTGSIQTKEEFGDMQLHIEWAAPAQPQGESQKRGNSGIFLMNRYEVQILDSYNAKTYADGQAAALYGQYPPLVNACRPPGQWQTYDIIFRRPRFENGQVTRPARVTVIHNGVVVQDAVEFQGRTTHGKRAGYEPHDDAEPFQLQDHNDNQPVRFRNIWVRKLGTVE